MENLAKTGRLLYGIGMIGIGIQHFIYRDFRPVIIPPLWPAWIHFYPLWAYIAGASFVVAGILICIGKKVEPVSSLLGGFLLMFFIIFHVPFLLFINIYSPLHLGLWTDPLKELALSGGAFVVAGFFKDPSNAFTKFSLIKFLEKLLPSGRFFFGITMVAFGIDHFLYTDFVATLVPLWMPGHVFWTYFAGAALIGSGLAIILKFRLKQIAMLLATMLLLWVVLLHIPRAVADPTGAFGNEITSVFEALAFAGIAIVISGRYDKRITM